MSKPTATVIVKYSPVSEWRDVYTCAARHVPDFALDHPDAHDVAVRMFGTIYTVSDYKRIVAEQDERDAERASAAS